MSSNIKVAIRVRPLISREKNDKLKEQWEVYNNTIYPIDVNTGKRNGDIYFFDHIFNNKFSNADIYNTVVHPVVNKAMNGFNGTIFAYGQTSSGKTYTMMGNANEHGLISTTVQNIFLAIEQSINRKFLLRVSYIEIYNEKIHDLLDIHKTVKVSEDLQGLVCVNVKEEITDSAEKVYEIMKKGEKARRIGETNLNEKSSRSHTIFRIIVESSDINDTGVVNVAHLNFVDLAGSERATFTKATGLRLKEGAHINKSLSALSLVMKQLSESQDYVNFRDSKLTRILQSSLGGNTLTAIICAVTPAALDETHSTLAFASRAKTVKNKPLMNEVVTDEALINRYAQEINKLKKDLEKANDNTNLQAQKIVHLQKCILFSKKTTICNKNRRKTWTGSNDQNRSLSVIYEDTSNLECEVFSGNNILDNRKFVPVSEKRKSPTFLMSPGLNDFKSLQPDLTIPGSHNNHTALNGCEDSSISWLVNSTETTKAVLRERANYYEEEFNSLKELTTQEKQLLIDEHNSEIEDLKFKFNHTKNELECERKLKTELEANLTSSNTTLQKQLEEVRNQNKELTKQIEKLTNEQNQYIDFEYSMKIYKEKFKNRENELLESLNEARNKLNDHKNNTDDEKNLKMSITPSLNMNHDIEEYKCQLNTLIHHLESSQESAAIQKLISEVKNINESIINNSNDYSEEFQDNFCTFKLEFELISVLFCNEALITELNNNKTKLQDEIYYLRDEIDILSTNLDNEKEIMIIKDHELEKLNSQLCLARNEIKILQLSAINKHENEIKNKTITDLTMKVNCLTEDIITITKKFNECKIEIEEYKLQINSYNNIIQFKDHEIKELSKQLSALTAELNQFKNDVDMERETKDIEMRNLLYDINMYSNEISILKRKIINLEADTAVNLEKCSKLDQNLEKYKLEIESSNNIMTSKDRDIKLYLERISSLTEELNQAEAECKSKDIEIENLLSNNNDMINELSVLKEKIIQLEAHLKTENDIKYFKDATITELTVEVSEAINKLSSVKKENEDQIKELSKQLSVVSEEFAAYRRNSDMKNELLTVENNQQKKHLDELNEKMSVPKINKFCQTEDVEVFNNTLLVAETKYSKMCDEYESKIKSLEQELLSLYEEINQLKLKCESKERNNEYLRKQICMLQEKIVYYETTLTQFKESSSQSEIEKNKILQIQEKSSAEIQKLEGKVIDQNCYIAQCHKESASAQTSKKNETILSQEMTLLTKKNENYKKIIEHITKKANSQISVYNEVVEKLKSENDKLRDQIKVEKKFNQTTQNQLTEMQTELNTKNNFKIFDDDLVKFQAKINSLEENKTKLEKIIDNYHVQTSKKSYEVNSLTKSVETLKNENIKLQNLNEDMSSKLVNIEVLLQSTKNKIELLECEKKNYADYVRILEESLEDTKFELHELKNKEREKLKKIKRQSLQDSSRSISNEDQLSTDEHQQNVSKCNKLEDSQLHKCDTCNLLDSQIKNLSDKCRDLENKYKKLLKTNEQLIQLCKIRKNEIYNLKNNQM